MSWRDKILEERGNMVKLQFEQEIKDPAILGWDDDDSTDENEIICGYLDDYSAMMACGSATVMFHREEDRLIILVCDGQIILDQYEVLLPQN